jgi:predicted transcriptional regulator
MSVETSSAILKNELHRMVVETDNPVVLRKIKSIFSILLEQGDEEDWWDTISEREKAAIQKGLKQLENGERIPHAVVRQEIDRLLGKQ